MQVRNIGEFNLAVAKGDYQTAKFNSPSNFPAVGLIEIQEVFDLCAISFLKLKTTNKSENLRHKNVKELWIQRLKAIAIIRGSAWGHVHQEFLRGVISSWVESFHP